MYFLSEGRRISYSDTGEGKAIVLIHGYLETAVIWQSYAEKLSQQFRVITVDLPGHGGSDQFGLTNTMESIAIIISGLLDHLKLKKVFMTGHSLGGYVTLAFLDLFPCQLSGYCLLHSQPFPDTSESVEKRKREIALTGDGKKELFYPGNISRMYSMANLEKFRTAVERSLEIAGGISEEGIIAVLRGMMERPSRLSVMEEGRVPCLWVLGAADNYIPCKEIQSKVKLPENARVVVLENSGHMGFIEEEELALEAVTGFVSGLE